MLVPEGEVETGRPYVRDDRVFISYRFMCGDARYQVELPVVLISPQIAAVRRTAPFFDSDGEAA